MFKRQDEGLVQTLLGRRLDRPEEGPRTEALGRGGEKVGRCLQAWTGRRGEGGDVGFHLRQLSPLAVARAGSACAGSVLDQAGRAPGPPEPVSRILKSCAQWLCSFNGRLARTSGTFHQMLGCHREGTVPSSSSSLSASVWKPRRAVRCLLPLHEVRQCQDLFT